MRNRYRAVLGSMQKTHVLRIAAVVAAVFTGSTVSQALDVLGGQTQLGLNDTINRQFRPHIEKTFDLFGFSTGRIGDGRVEFFYSHETGNALLGAWDDRIKELYQAGVRPIINPIQYTKEFEINTAKEDRKYQTYPLLDNYGPHRHPYYKGAFKWYKIGRALANRYRPGSDWNLEQGHAPDWGVEVYMILNEVDGNWFWEKLDENNDVVTEEIELDNGDVITRAVKEHVNLDLYYAINEAFADGVKSVDPELKVYLGPMAHSYAWNSSGVFAHQWRHYLKKVAPLFNDGRLDGFGLQLYFDENVVAPAGGTKGDRWINQLAWERFNYGKEFAGITSNPAFYATEYGTKRFKENSDSVQDTNLMIANTINQITVTGDNGEPVTDFALVYNVAAKPSRENQTYAFIEPNSSFSAIDAALNGRAVMMMSRILDGKEFTSINHETGVHQLTGNGETAWLFNNMHWQSSISGTSFLVEDIPAKATELRVYRYDSFVQENPGDFGELAPERVITIGNNTREFLIDGLLEEHPYLITANAEQIASYSILKHMLKDGLIVEAEHFNHGGTSQGFKDLDSTNSGNSDERTGGADLFTVGATGVAVGDIQNGEWLRYTIPVISAGAYEMDIKILSESGAANGAIRLVQKQLRPGKVLRSVVAGEYIIEPSLNESAVDEYVTVTMKDVFIEPRFDSDFFVEFSGEGYRIDRFEFRHLSDAPVGAAITIKSRDNNRYLTSNRNVNGSQRSTYFNRTDVGGEEQWLVDQRLSDVGTNNVTLRGFANNGTFNGYLRVIDFENRAVCNSMGAGADTQLVWEPIGSTLNFGLKSSLNGLYLNRGVGTIDGEPNYNLPATFSKQNPAPLFWELVTE